jgi:hypothetical protein
MIVREARAIAREWVEQYGSRIPGYCGAYLSGSFLQAAEDDIWPETSDIDIVAVIDGEIPEIKPGKFIYSSVLLEVSLIHKKEYASMEHILSTHYLAYALHMDGILNDPHGFLEPLHLEVKEQYAREYWVHKRCQSFIAHIRDSVAHFNRSAPFHEQVTGWLFRTGITAFPILAAALKNCTVRKRYTAARTVLEEYGLMDFYPPLIRLLTGDAFKAGSLPGFLKELETTFDLAANTRGPSARYPFRSDISFSSRPVAIDGSRRLIESAYPMEAVFWMVATFARCHAILSMDAPQLQQKRLPAFHAFMSGLGITGTDAMGRRNEELLAFLPEVEHIADAIIEKRIRDNRNA